LTVVFERGLSRASVFQSRLAIAKPAHATMRARKPTHGSGGQKRRARGFSCARKGKS
jgi:hypothetical protein